MIKTWRPVLLLPLLAALAAPVRAEVPIMPIEDVEVGMKGIGRTVFQGSLIEDFDITVIGLLEGFDFEMDMILIRVDSGPVVTKDYGIVAGMSGSPIYIDGKMIGALAYGWEFQREPIAGVTPIEQMLLQHDPNHPDARAARERRQERERRKREQRAGTQTASRAEGRLKPAGELMLRGRSVDQIQLAANRQQAEHWSRSRPDIPVLTPVATPVYVKGLSANGVRMLDRLFEPYNLVPMQVGGAKVPQDVEVVFEPGAAIAVPIAQGDIELTGIGTMTYRDDATNLVMGFGHPFFGFGSVEMPMATGYIQAVISSAMSSNKLGGAVREIGVITQDRPTMIGGKIGPRADLLPIQYSLTEPERGTHRQFNVELIRNPALTDLYTAIMMMMAMQNVAGGGFDGVTNSRIEIDTRVEEDGEQLEIVRNNSFDTKAINAFGINPLWDLFQTLTLLRQNPFGEAQLKEVRVELEFLPNHRLASIERAQAGQQVVKRGETFEVTVHVKPYGGKSEAISFPVTVPEHAPLGPLVVVLIGGNDAAMLRPRINPPPNPIDVPSLVQWLNNTVENESILAEIVLPTTGLEVTGHQLHDLPEPFVQPLATSSDENMRQIPDVVERHIPTDRVIAGAAAVVVEVVGEEGRRQDQSVDYSVLRGPELMPQETPAMEEMSARAALRLRSYVGVEDLAPDLPFQLRPGADRGRALAEFDELVQRAWRTAQGRRPAQPWYRRPAGTDSPTRDQLAEGGPAAGGENDGDGEETPDITSSLDLNKPPRMPAWDELDELGKGNLLTEADEGAEGDGEKKEDEDGKPLARPVSVWTINTAEEFTKGWFDGTFPSGDGRVSLAPSDRALGTPDADRIWSLLPRPDGSVIVGSWAPKAKLFRLSEGSEPELWLETEDAGLVALAPLPDGSFVAGGIPSGTIYRVTGQNESTVFAQLDEEYIWRLVPDGEGGLFAATGREGRLYHVSADGEAKMLMQSGDRHILALAAAPEGGVFAGTFPLGKVYHVTADGTVRTVYQSPEGGVLSLTATPNGSLFVGTAGTGKIVRVSPSGVITEVAAMEGGNIYALAHQDNVVYAAAAQPAQLLRIDEEGVKAQLFRSDEPFMLDIAPIPGRGLVATVAGSGEVIELALRGTEHGEYLSPVHDAGMRARWGVARWASECSEGALVGLQTRSGNTSFPDKAWSDWSTPMGQASGSTITSPPARYLQFRAVFDGQEGDTCRLDRVDLLYRTLNRAPTLTVKAPGPGEVVRDKVKIKWESEDPDDDTLYYEVFYAPAGTEDWQKVEEPAKDDEKEDDEDAEEEPSDEDATAEPAAAAALLQPLNGYRSARQVGWTHWLTPRPVAHRPLAEAPVAKVMDAKEEAVPDQPDGEAPAGDEEDAEEKPAKPERLTDETITWATKEVPDGLYQLKIVAIDRIRNPEDPKQVAKVTKPFRVDNTGPYLLEITAGAGLPPEQIPLAEDGTWLASAEYRIDDGEWTALVPVDGIFDQRFETIERPELPAEPGLHTFVLRVRDAAGNLSRFEWTLGDK